MAILTVDELREHVTSGLEDDALQRLLDASEEEIVRYAGEPGATTEIVNGGSRFITLDRPAASVSLITETWGASTFSLAADDYLIYPSGLVVERLTTGPHGRFTWWQRVTVTYTPTDEVAMREKAQINLVQLALNYSPGATMEQIGSWTEQFSRAVADNQAEADAILSTLSAGPRMVVVGW